MVGTSTSAHRNRNVGELVDTQSQRQTLSLFKAGIINIVM